MNCSWVIGAGSGTETPFLLCRAPGSLDMRPAKAFLGQRFQTNQDNGRPPPFCGVCRRTSVSLRVSPATPSTRYFLGRSGLFCRKNGPAKLQQSFLSKSPGGRMRNRCGFSVSACKRLLISNTSFLRGGPKTWPRLPWYIVFFENSAARTCCLGDAPARARQPSTGLG